MIRQVEDQMGVSVEDLNISLEGCCNQCKDKQEKEKEVKNNGIKRIKNRTELNDSFCR